MTVDPRIERALPRILADLGSGPAPDYVDRLLERTIHVRQRPAWVFPERWLGLDVALDRAPARLVPWRVIGLALLLIAAIVGAAIAAAIGAHRLPPPFGPARNGVVTFARDGRIYVADPTDRTPRSMISDSDYDFGPIFSPDGTQVAFLRRVNPVADGATDILVGRTDGSDLHFVTTEPLREIPPVVKWAPNSAALFVVTNDRGEGLLERFDATRTAPPTVIDPGLRVDGVAFQPPDGRRILFRGQSGNRIGLYLMDPDGTHVTTLVEPYSSDHLVDENFIQEATPCVSYAAAGACDTLGLADLRDSIWSPDGTKIVFRRTTLVDGVDQTSLFMIAADGGGLQQIGYTTGDMADAHPVWSPDGTRIAFMRYRDGLWGFAVLSLADGTVRPTGPSIVHGLAAASWAPDGTSILVIEHAGDQQALVLDPAGGPWQVTGWTAESPNWWELRGIPNGSDTSIWQRLATP